MKLHDTIINYKHQKKIYKNLSAEFKPDIACIAIAGLRPFIEWKYFLCIYGEMIEDRRIREFYLQYYRFYIRSYSVNIMWIPTFQGEQSGNPICEKELLETALVVINKKIERY